MRATDRRPSPLAVAAFAVTGIDVLLMVVAVAARGPIAAGIALVAAMLAGSAGGVAFLGRTPDAPRWLRGMATTAAAALLTAALGLSGLLVWGGIEELIGR